MYLRNRSFVSVSALVVALCSASVAAAQDMPSDTSTQSAPTGDNFDEIVVTGRAGGSDLRKAEVSFAITTLDDQQLRISNPISAAETFKQVPGFWVESSGGEGSNNVRARGIPTDGFSSVALQENGLSVQYDGGLGYLNADQSFRFDETIERVEAVRGGPASIFAPNAPGGVVNFITRRGSQDPGGLVKYSWGDYGLHRVDAYFGAPVGENWGVFVGGFYRRSDGLRDMGFTAEKGGQLRATVDYDDGDNRFLFDVKHIDDRTPFYLPVPLTFNGDGDIVEVPGFDARHGTLAGPENRNVPIKLLGRTFDFDLSEGSHTQSTQITMEGRFQASDSIGFETRTRYRDSDMLRNALFPTGNVTPIADYLASIRTPALAAFPGATGLAVRYATDGAAFDATSNGNGLVVGGNLLSVNVPIREIITDNRFTAEFEAGGKHSFAIGGSYAWFSYDYEREMGTTLLDVQDNARRLDILAVNAAGAVVGRVTDNGFQRYGSLFDDAAMTVRSVALYAGDEWQITPQLRIDFAGRYEKTHITGAVAKKQTVNLGDPTTLADNQVLTAAPGFDLVDREFDDWGWTIGANWQFSDYGGVFARYTDTFRLPSAGEYNGNPGRTDQRSVPIQMAELGFKYGTPTFSLFATGYFSRFQGVTFTDNVFQTDGSFVQRTVVADTETWGVEAEMTIRPVHFADLRVAATYQRPEYKGFVFTEIVNGAPVQRDFDGNQLIRVPRLALRAVPGVNLLDGRVRAELEVEHYTKRYPDVANSQVLPAYTVLNVNLRANVTDNLTLSLNATNLTNELGLTEGNPRAGSFVSGDAGAKYFLARPIFGRTVRASVSFRF